MKKRTLRLEMETVIHWHNMFARRNCRWKKTYPSALGFNAFQFRLMPAHILQAQMATTGSKWTTWVFAEMRSFADYVNYFQ